MINSRELLDVAEEKYEAAKRRLASADRAIENIRPLTSHRKRLMMLTRQREEVVKCANAAQLVLDMQARVRRDGGASAQQLRSEKFHPDLPVIHWRYVGERMRDDVHYTADLREDDQAPCGLYVFRISEATGERTSDPNEVTCAGCRADMIANGIIEPES